MNPFFKQFSYPLNVYAYTVEKEAGHVDYLHYGLFDSHDTPVIDAQAKASELLWQHLPPSCKLLEVGIGLGTTLSKLCREGYSVTGITPDALQIDFAKHRHGEQLPAFCSRLEDYREAEGQWEALLFQESAQYIDPIDLFEAATRLLTANGSLVVMDEFAIQRMEHLHYLEHFLRLAERAGFTLETRIDLSQAAQPTLDWLLAAVNKHSRSIGDELAVPPETLAQLEASNKAYLEKYRNRQYGYFLLTFKRNGTPPWRIGRILPERSSEMRALFSEVFDKEMSEAHWQWKYGNGRGASIGIWRNADNRLIAQYGGITRKVVFLGQAALACQPCDVMVKTSDRGSLTRKGPVFLAAATFIEHELGYGAPHLLAYGFPNDRAFRLPQLLGLYEGCGKMQELIWPTTNEANHWLWHCEEITLSSPEESTAADLCWRTMATALSDRIIGVRDAAYLLHRYVTHPDKRYRLFIVRHRFGLKPAGIFIVHTDNAERCELLDVIGSPGKLPLLVDYARKTAGSLGCSELYLWAAADIAAIFGPCPKIVDLPVTIPSNVWTDGPSNESLTGKWWLTGGDTDFH